MQTDCPCTKLVCKDCKRDINLSDMIDTIITLRQELADMKTERDQAEEIITPKEYDQEIPGYLGRRFVAGELEKDMDTGEVFEPTTTRLDDFPPDLGSNL